MSRFFAACGLLAWLAACGQAPSGDTNAAVYDAWRAGRSHVEVTASGVVSRDFGVKSGRASAHEGFLLHLSGASGRGLTVRVEANVDFTGPLPISAGSPVRVRGEYEFDPRGGVIHWTHRDPRGRHPDGYIEIQNKRYG